MAGYTKFTNLEAGELKAAGVRADALSGALRSPLAGVSLSKSANYSLAEDEKVFYIGVTLTAASKTVTLGLKTGQVAVVVNEGGTNAFTLKNVSGDTGTSVAAGKAYLVQASTTANGSKLTLLNNYTA